MYELVNIALELCKSPNSSLYIKFAAQTLSLLKESTIQKAIKKVGDAHLNAVCDIAATIDKEKNKSGAIQRILTHLESAYYIYVDYYKHSPKLIDLPYIWIGSAVVAGVRGTFKVEETLEKICLLIAIYHKALGDDPILMKKWILDTEYCTKTDFLKYLVGEKLYSEYMEEYKKSHKGGSYGTGTYYADYID